MIVAAATVVVVTRPGCSTARGTTLPRLERTLSSIAVASTATIAVVFDRTTRLTASATHFGHESIELVLGGTADAPLLTAVAESVVVAPGLADLAFGTVASHVTSLATDATDDAGREVLLLRAIVLAMTNLSTVLTGLVLVVAKGTVEGGELSELVALEFVLTFGDGCSLKLLLVLLDMIVWEQLTVSMTLWISFLALLTFSSVSAMIKQCKSSSWLLVWAASERPLPSFTEPLPRIAIFA